MNTSIQPAATSALRLRIDGEFSIYRAAELKEMVLTAVAQAPCLELDLSAVSELDTAGVQILLLARQSALARGHSLRLVDSSAAVQATLALLRVSPEVHGAEAGHVS
ncbi:STAS domain-containing protein [Rugamonas sp. FT82W]|uniref:STAS domain-containing protein n=1 Tax=Duganella vulcania TaxID=2692166 RepID=A0A845G289_9BURK|nr:STAS domain-containing protein [Duganella vulcania]MYM87592.1 STAS domain-containing protein [Duganella vulcania]